MKQINYTELGETLRLYQQPSDRYEELSSHLLAEDLIVIARREAGMDEFGDDSFLTPLRKLLDSVARDVDFSDQGLADFRRHIVRCLVNKLRMHEDFTRHPEIFEEDVSDPIVVIGLPRTGTTKMQRILSSLPDSDIQKTYLWQMLNPAPFPDAPSGQLDPRIAAASTNALNSEGRPQYQAAHASTSMDPEEDGLICDSTFDDWVWSSVFAPSVNYYEWVMQRPQMPVYKHLHRMYQYLQWQNGGRRNRLWVSKNVQHIAHLDELLKFFPNATLIHCHRNPIVSISSLAKLSMEVWRPVMKSVDPVFTGQAMRLWWSSAISRYMESRQRLGLDERIIDLPYQRIRHDAVNVVQEIFTQVGRPLSSEQLGYVSQWERDNEQHKNGKHEYSLEAFGLSTEQIESDFSDYMHRFETLLDPT